MSTRRSKSTVPTFKLGPTPTADRALAWLRDPRGDEGRLAVAAAERLLLAARAPLSHGQADALRRAPILVSGLPGSLPAASRWRLFLDRRIPMRRPAAPLLAPMPPSGLATEATFSLLLSLRVLDGEVTALVEHSDDPALIGQLFGARDRVEAHDVAGTAALAEAVVRQTLASLQRECDRLERAGDWPAKKARRARRVGR